MKPPSKYKQACAILCIFIPTVVLAFCISIHIVGSNFLTTATIGTLDATVSFAQSIKDTVRYIAPNLTNSLTTLNANINSSIDGLTGSVNFDSYNNQVKPSFDNMIGLMVNIQTDKETVLNQYPSVANGTSQLQTSATLLSQMMGVITSACANISVAQVINATNSNETWRGPTVDSSLDASKVQQNANNAPNTTSIFSSLSTSANLTEKALNISSKVTTGIDSARKSINSTKASLQGTISQTLKDLGGTISDAVSGIEKLITFGDNVKSAKDFYVTQDQFR